jgi:hypothetical protein
VREIFENKQHLLHIFESLSEISAGIRIRRDDLELDCEASITMLAEHDGLVASRQLLMWIKASAESVK